MKHTIRRLLSLALALTAACWLAVPTFAREASVTFDGQAQKFLFEPGSDHSPTDLFADFKSVMPGDSLTQTITVKNDPSHKVKVKLYLRSQGAEEGSEAFLSEMKLTVRQDGETELFAAPADQTAGLSDWVSLGTFYSGAEVNLEVTLDVPMTLGNDFQQAVGRLNWEFRAEELPVQPDDPRPPETGENTRAGVYALLAAGSAGCLLLTWTKKRRGTTI